MSTQHTPGPWKAVYVGCGDWDLTGPVTQEDWTLAAAAPDLLEALCMAHDYLAGNGWDNDDRMNPIRAAITKATNQPTAN
jgi:hypothetical protein